MNFDESTVNKIKRLEREVERLKAGSEKALPDGWIPVSATWTYASATTITVPSGAASIYSVGDKIKLNNTDTKYFYIVGVADTVLTITGGSDYTLDSDAISAVYYSKAATPLGFPQWFNLAAPTFTVAELDNGSGGQPASTLTKFTVNGRALTVEYLGSGTKAGTGNLISFALNTGTGFPLPAQTYIGLGSFYYSAGVNGVGVMIYAGGAYKLFCMIAAANITDNLAALVSYTMSWEI